MEPILIQLIQKLLSNEELALFEKKVLFANDDLYEKLLEFDQKLGGIGIYNINHGDLGRYHVNDRDIFRPLQYIERYFQLDYENRAWVTREIIHMCGLHLESMMKNIFLISRLPLGQAVAQKAASLKLGRELVNDIKEIVKLYNDSKHRVDQDKDSHLFSVQDAVMCYVATRKISMSVVPYVKLDTPEDVWNIS
ncbi:hypothetical protein [Brevibacillus panacihumi]|uniref:DUF4145 domain-containing protein n=1 Tax=Brevibacillus panacihumi TaxID=497735 RepID=A0A3M8C436_9BACL|nr:hypothetical protein [Brevibacillus panacihumi]RNB70404.1 hypothetical protein EDM58_23235 [Brevibacillus panacihumi]